MKKIKSVIFLILTAALLQGCIFVAGAAAGAAGVAVVYDHRKIEKILLDERIAKKIADLIQQDDELKSHSHIEVNCFNQIVLLTGETTTNEFRDRALEIANSVPNVKRVYNQINIKGPASKLIEASDTWITTKIKSQMLATKGLQSSTVKVVTENGTVYLMGMVSHDQADIAVNIAKQVSGVQRVIKIFQYK